MSHPLLKAPIGRSLIRLAGPTTALMLVQVIVSIADGIFIGRLGIEALAGTALVIPFVTLMYNVANGGMGGAVAASLARALGAGRLDDARAIVVHSMILATGFAISFTLGASDWQGLGVAGSAVASVVVAAGTTCFLASAIHKGGLGFTPIWIVTRLRWSIFREILGVGIPGSITALITNLTTVVMIGLVGGFGVVALAAYGIGTRLEYIIGPVAFGIGSGLTTMVGIAAGAKQWQRAVHVAWAGGLTAFAVVGSIVWLVAIHPELWVRLFTSDDLVVAASRSYIHHVAPFFCLFGLGITLSFASQGAGRMKVPFLASCARMVATTVAGWIVVEKTSFGLDGLFGAISLGMIVYGVIIAGFLLVNPWRDRIERANPV